MKDTHFLYGIAILAVVGITVVFVGYATETLPMHIPRQIVTTTTPVTTGTMAPKKPCHCCAERMAKLRAHLDQLRERERAAAQKMESK